jgi:hypothetical protein
MTAKLSCCHFTSFRRKNGEKKYWTNMEMLGIMMRPKNVFFQQQYAQCFIALTSFLNAPATNDYNCQSPNLSTLFRIPDEATVNSPSLSHS